jgi:hypothetical protein
MRAGPVPDGQDRDANDRAEVPRRGQAGQPYRACDNVLQVQVRFQVRFQVRSPVWFPQLVSPPIGAAERNVELAWPYPLTSVNAWLL